MIAWINFAVLVLSTALTGILYVISVSPARMARRIGPSAYPRCGRIRTLCGIFMTLACVCYVVYVFHPLPLPLPQTFPWPWWVSALIAAGIGIPSAWLMIRGVIDAGEETMHPREGHTMYGGIYGRIRHPQAVGEMPLFWVIALLLHSPFLVIYSVVWVPIFVLMSWAEERDLLIRYGAAYEEYRRRTAAMIPGMW